MSALGGFFFLGYSPRSAAGLCRQTASVRPALEILRTPPRRGGREGGRGVEVVVGLLRGVGISQRRSVRLDAAQLTSQQEHTCAFLADPGRQAGGASVSQSVSPLSSTERRRKSPQLL